MKESFAIYFVIWGWVFMFAAIPGILVGWLLGRFVKPRGAGLALAIFLPVIPGLLAGQGSHSYQYPLMFVPPILLAALLGFWFSNMGRGRSSTEASSSLGWTFGAVAVALIAGLAYFFLSEKANRVRLTIEIETPAGIKVASSAVETTLWPGTRGPPVRYG
jgi:hypothetical protein